MHQTPAKQHRDTRYRLLLSVCDRTTALKGKIKQLSARFSLHLSDKMERRTSTAIDVVGKQSLLTALNRFVTAVNDMDDIVMIPSRLRDLEGPLPNIAEENNNTNKNSNDETAVAVPSIQSGTDLYRCFSMLHVIRDEIIAGSKPEEETEQQSGASAEGEDSEDDETSARNTANMFRYHLRGLFGLLHQLTATAQYLGSRYDRDVSQNQTTFSLNM